ncbi:MAG: hypothetical protein IPM54_39670 [Polyangiaceae bacterium]|nr:hypothetical protein [Polyangiaceae bacterium]
MSPVHKSPPLDPKAKGSFATYQELRAFRPEDPFFDASSGATEHDRWAMARDQRKQARILHSSLEYRISRVIVYAIFGSVLVLSMGLFVPLGIRWLMNPANDGHLRGFLYSVVYALIAWSLVGYAWTQIHRISRSVRTLGQTLGGSCSKNRYLDILDWLDAHWPASTPRDEIEPPAALMEQRWDIRSSYHGRPLLILVHRRLGSRRVTPLRRLSFYLSAPQNEPWQSNGVHPALKDLEALGFWAKQTPAGIYLCHEGISPEALDPSRVSMVLAIACRMLDERGER